MGWCNVHTSRCSHHAAVSRFKVVRGKRGHIFMDEVISSALDGGLCEGWFFVWILAKSLLLVVVLL